MEAAVDTAAAPAADTAKLPPELQQLQTEAALLDQDTSATAGAQPGADGLPAEDAVDWDADAEGLVNIASEALGAFYPSTEKVLTEDKRARIAKALAPVMRKHGWSLAWLFGKFGEEIQLAFVCSQIAIPLAKAIRADREAAKREKAQQPTEAMPPAASSATTAAPPAAAPGADLFTKA